MTKKTKKKEKEGVASPGRKDPDSALLHIKKTKEEVEFKESQFKKIEMEGKVKLSAALREDITAAVVVYMNDYSLHHSMESREKIADELIDFKNSVEHIKNFLLAPQGSPAFIADSKVNDQLCLMNYPDKNAKVETLPISPSESEWYSTDRKINGKIVKPKINLDDFLDTTRLLEEAVKGAIQNFDQDGSSDGGREEAPGLYELINALDKVFRKASGDEDWYQKFLCAAFEFIPPLYAPKLPNKVESFRKTISRARKKADL